MTDISPSNAPAPEPASASGGRVAWVDLDRPGLLSHRLPAWALSLVLHTVLLVLMVLFVRVTQRGGALEAARGTGIVITQDVEGEAQYFDDVDGLFDSTSTAASQDLQSGFLNEQQLPLDLDGFLPKRQEGNAGDQVADSFPSASSVASGAPAPRGKIDGNEARTSIFGAEGTGNKFVYVFDRSASMAGYQGRPLAAAKRELIASLHDLTRLQQFQVLFYNDSERPTVFNPYHPQPPRMLFGDEQTLRLAENFIRGVVAAGGTEHIRALRFALAMQPDVIFFLTDAAEPQLTVKELDEMRRKNARIGATIHAIEFGSGPKRSGVSFLRRLALQNGGQHVYVDVTRLRGEVRGER